MSLSDLIRRFDKNRMPAFLEAKLKKEYGAESDIPYKIMNKMGAMRGNKITDKGRAMEAKHEADMKGKRKRKKPASFDWRK